MGSAVNQCLDEWCALLSHDRVLVGEAIKPYQNNCLSIKRQIVAVLKPTSENEVTEIVRIATTQNVPLYTISTGHNWGYGTSIPVAENCAILDLSLMNVIRDLDAELGLVTLEPGVTQKQLLDYLAERGLDFYVPTTGAGPTASIVGNALERGFGMTPVEDHFLGVTSMRAVLADGSIYQSPLSEMGGVNAGVWKWGIGPYVDGIFAQGNMGIVTALQIALVKRPQHTEVFVFTLKQGVAFEQMMEACRVLQIEMRGVLGGMKLLNREQLISTIGTNEMGMSLANDYEWVGIGVFRCRKSMVGSIRKEVKQLLSGTFSKLVFINNKRNQCYETLFKCMPSMWRAKCLQQLERAKHLMDIVNGIPRGLELRLVYQKVKMTEQLPVDPVRDGVGILWYAPIMPMKTGQVVAMLSMIKTTLEQYGFPGALSFTTVGDRCAIGVIPIIYDRPSEAEKAHECFNALWDAGNALGCPPYRINVAAMDKLTNHSSSIYWQTVSRIKAALDPNDIISPGRYAPLLRKAD